MISSKSIFFSKTFIGLLVAFLVPLLGKYGISVDSDGLTTDLIGAAGLGFAVYGRFKATQPVHVIAPGAPPAPPAQQSGFIYLRLLGGITIGALLLILCGCTTLGIAAPPAPQTISESLIDAEGLAGAVDALAAQLLVDKVITVAQAKDVEAAADLVHAGVLAARALLAAGNATGAQAQLDSLQSSQAQLSAFAATHPPTP